MSKEIALGFIEMLKDLNITKEQLNVITHLGITIEFESDFYYKNKSNIHGDGVFALKSINKGDVIGIGSGGNYALASAKVLMDTELSAEEVAKKAIKVASEICVFTNDNIKIEKI